MDFRDGTQYEFRAVAKAIADAMEALPKEAGCTFNQYIRWNATIAYRRREGAALPGPESRPRIRDLGTSIELYWDSVNYAAESSESLDGDWETHPDWTSPHTVVKDKESEFYRLVPR